MKNHFTTAAALLLTMSVAAQSQPENKDSLGLFYQLQEIKVTGVKQAPHSINKVDAKQIKHYNKPNVTEALNLLPGLAITEMGARNEGSITLRGFDNRRTPVFYDGIPIYAPYDGNFDLNRFTAYDIASIAADKRLLSVKYGPNTMGGAINIISRKPTKTADINGQIGAGFADGAGVNSYFGTINAGTLQEKWYAMGSLTIDKANNFMLSKDFEATQYQPTGERLHSAHQDAKVSAKVGYTPNQTDEYSLNFLSQMARKDISTNSINGATYRDYPIYQKSSIYAKTHTLIAPKTFMNFTGYYDAYYNIMRQFDNNTYTLQNNDRRPPSFTSIYDDYTLGAALNFTTEALKYNTITLSFTDKYDHHTEHNAEIPANTLTGQKYRAGEPEQHYKDNTLFVGLEDVITLAKPLSLVLGGSYTTRNNILAQEYGTHYQTNQKDVLYDFPTGSDNSFDYKGGLLITPAEGHLITLSAEKRSRFASQKERYSARFGSAEPNPDLKSEYTMAYEVSYSGNINNKLSYEVAAFYNDITDAIYDKVIRTEVIQQRRGTTTQTIYQNQNIGKAESKGFEVGFGYTPIKYITFGANYSYIEIKNKETNSSEEFTGVPKYKVIGYANFHIPQLRTHLYVNTETYGKRYVDDVLSKKKIEAHDFTLINAKLSYDILPTLGAEVSVKNLLDKDYYLTMGYPRAGRSFLVALGYHF